MVAADKAAGNSCFYIIDGQHHETIDDAASFLQSNLGNPTYVINCTAGIEEITARLKEKDGNEEALGEEDIAVLKEKAAAAAEVAQRLRGCWADFIDRVKWIDQDTAMSKESLAMSVRSNFSAKVVLVNHEKRIEVDTACSNLAIKYNMLYLSVYQLIRKEILAETDLGVALKNSKREKELDFGHVTK